MISRSLLLVVDDWVLTTRPVGVNPGGSGRLDDLGFETGFELRSMTHLGGGGGITAALDAIVFVFGGWIVGREGGEVVIVITSPERAGRSGKQQHLSPFHNTKHDISRTKRFPGLLSRSDI